jgi:hypothetical protein
MNWKRQLKKTLPLLGHRNWILVVDKAYPMQSAPGIETIYTNEKLLYVLGYVLKTIHNEKHTKPVIYHDKELLFMRDDLCEGVESFKNDLTRMLSRSDLQVIPHDEIFSKLDTASKQFSVLVVKSDCLIPYTSVFIELDCGYWADFKEKTLRERIKT